MTNVTTKSESLESATATAVHLFDKWFDPIESGVRERVREFIEALICGELDAALARPRCGRARVMTPVRQALLATDTAAARTG
jgi:putative transposase